MPAWWKGGPEWEGSIRGGFRFMVGSWGAMEGSEQHLPRKVSGQGHFRVMEVFLRLRSYKAPPLELPFLTLEVQSYG